MLTVDLVQEFTDGILRRAEAPRPQEEKRTRWGRGVRMSEMGGCARKQTLRIAGYRGEYPTKFDQAAFDAGNAWEDYIYDLWGRKFPGGVQRGVAVPTQYGTGEIDLWIPEIKHIVECKSVAAAKASFIPNNEHVIQLQLYQHFFGQEHDATAELTYVIKDADDQSGEVVSIPQEYDPDLAQRLVQRMREIYNAGLAKDVLPISPGYNASSFPCGWGHGRCAFWTYCWGEGKV